MNTVKILTGDVMDMLKRLPDNSVQCVVTSPPYMNLRDYQTAIWEGGDPACEHIKDPNKTKVMGNAEFNEKRPGIEATKLPGYYYDTVCEKCGATKVDKQIGLEETPEEYVDKITSVFREVRRVLREDGICWLNIGDSYSGSGNGRNADGSTANTKGKQVTNQGSCLGTIKPKKMFEGIKPKNIIGIPWMVAFSLRADGWNLRQSIIWAKGCSGVYKGGNPMPESVRDRCTKAHENIFLLTKSQHYFYDSEAIKEDCITDIGDAKIRFGGTKYGDSDDPKHATKSGNVYVPAAKRNMRDVWVFPTKPFKGAHFASFSMDLITPAVKAGISEKGCCPKCGAPYVREIKRTHYKRTELPESDPRHRPNSYNGSYEDINGRGDAGYTDTQTVGWRASCGCNAGEAVPCVVLDPFGGSGTTAIVAAKNGADSIMVELNPAYVEIMKTRFEDYKDIMKVGE